MGRNKLKAAVVYISPAGTTRSVALRLSRVLEEEGWYVELFDLYRREPSECSAAVEKALEAGGCLFAGCPVYIDRALPPVVWFLSHLSRVPGRHAVPFVTWGGVNSGVALLEMAQVLEERGYRLLGAAKILAVHSHLWYCEHPLGEGHPDAGDEALIKQLVTSLTAKMREARPPLISLKELRYQPPELEKGFWSSGLGIARTTFDMREVDTELCSECGICRDECPVRAIEKVPPVIIRDVCIRCYNCVRLCPEGVIKLDFTGFEEKVKKRAADYAEQPPSQIFV